MTTLAPCKLDAMTIDEDGEDEGRESPHIPHHGDREQKGLLHWITFFLPIFIHRYI